MLPATPDKLTEMLFLIENNSFVDGIGAPSGYGLPLKKLDQLTAEDYFLLSLKPNEKPHLLRKFLEGMKGLVNCPCYLLPGVKHLSTVPSWKKINKIDLGTADKLCATIWSLEHLSRELDVNWSDLSFIHVELGFAFNAFISVKKGKISGGIGGSCASSGFLSGGYLDAEVAYLLGKDLSKSTVFSGGARINGVKTPSELWKADNDRWKAYIEGILVDVTRIDPKGQIKTVCLSGRFLEDKLLVNCLKNELEGLGRKIYLIMVEGKASTAARGSAVLVNGLLGGNYSSLVTLLELTKASGSVLDFIDYPIKSLDETR